MKILTYIFLFLILLFCSCKNKQEENTDSKYFNNKNSKIYNFILQDSITDFTFTTPLYFDTTFQWIHSVCGIQYQKIRAQNKKLPIHLENGYFDLAMPKYYSEITFKQQLLKEKLSKMTREEVVQIHSSDRESYLENPKAKLFMNLDTIINVNDNYYSILGYYFVPDKNSEPKKQIVITNFNAGYTFVRATFINTDTNVRNKRFIRDCIETIKSIQISGK